MIERILKSRRIVLLVLVLTTLGLAPFAIGLKPDNSVESMGVINDPAIADMHRLEKTFGSDEFVSVSFAHPDIFSPAGLKIIQDLSRNLKATKNIQRVTSLTEAEDILPVSRDGEEALTIQPLIRTAWYETGVPPNERERILKNPLYQRLIFNQQGNASSLYAQLKPLGTDNPARDQVIAAIQDIVDRFESDTGIRFHLLGIPIMDRKVYGTVEKEQHLTTGVIMALVALVFWLLYRRWSLVLLPVTLFGVVAIWTTGVIGMSGLSFNWLLAMTPGVVLIISVCNAIHVINAFLNHPEPDNRQRLSLVVRLLWLPCFFTCLTDIAGFFSIATSQIAPIRDFGLCVGLGSVISFLMMILVLPIFLSWIKVDTKQVDSVTLTRWIHAILHKTLHWGIAYTNRVLVICLLVISAGLLGLTRLEAEQHMVTMYKWNSRDYFEANEFVKTQVGSGSEFSAFIDTGKPDKVLDPKLLRTMSETQARIEAEVDLVIKTLSLSDLIKFANQAVHGNNPAYYTIPDTKEAVAELLLIYSMGEKSDLLHSLVTPDYSETRVRIFTPISDSAKAVGTDIAKAEAILKEVLSSQNVPFHLSGRPIVIMNTFYSIIESQFATLGVAFAIILLGMCILFRSIKIGLICMIPNILPILFSLGMVAWLGMKVEVATSMVASTIIGVTVDDTIHFMWHLHRKLGEGKGYDVALKEVFHETASAAFFSTLIVSVGFMGLVVSQLWPTTHFGILTATSCVVALATELFLTPALLYKFKPFASAMVAPSNALPQLSLRSESS